MSRGKRVGRLVLITVLMKIHICTIKESKNALPLKIKGDKQNTILVCLFFNIFFFLNTFDF